MDSDRLSRFNPDDFKCIIIDEAHHAPSQTYVRILSHFDALHLSNRPRSHILVWGCSATLRRHDGIRLSDIFEVVSYYKTILDLWEDGWLCPAKAYRVLTDTDISGVTKRGSDFNLSQLSAKVDTQSRNSAVVSAWKQHVARDPRHSTLVFAVDVQHVQHLTAEFRAQGVDARYVDGSTSKEERFDLLEGFRKREYPVLVNCQVFTEGTDIPGVDCVLMARPTASPVLFQQMIGRGLRLYPGKEDCVILDCVDVCKKRDVVTLPSLLGLEPHFNMKGMVAYDVYRRMKDLVDIEPDCLESESIEAAERVSSGFDVKVKLKQTSLQIDKPLAITACEKYAWTKLTGGCFGLQLVPSGELLILKQLEGGYQLYLKSKDGKQTDKQKQSDRKNSHSFRLLGSFDSLLSAFNGAGTYIGSCGNFLAKLLDRSAKWRFKPATQRQKELVNKLFQGHIQDIDGLTQGRASHMLGRWFLNQSLKQLRKQVNSPPHVLEPMFEIAWLNKTLLPANSKKSNNIGLIN
ncbi:uncharacterized protein LOC134178343 isoform X2 [Corticium candelabrum]|nr:uncharacterized protein LOC134178343 isoform X2 [Corticium candelabrum]